MNSSRRLLITGHRGYLGSVMAPYFVRAGYDVTGLDAGYFDECTLVPDPCHVPEVRKDLRDLEPGDLAGFDAVIHLAALSNDPVGRLDAGWTDEINHRASVRLAELAKAGGVRRFLFSSSCSMYGMSEARVVDEDARLDPKTEYARSKVRTEAALRELADDAFSPTFLRNGTVYGVSPRMRFDTVLNDLVGAAIATGRIIVYGDGTPWRPVVHIDDVARGFHRVLEAPREAVHNQAFNNGADHLNHRVGELAEIVAGVVPGCRLEVQDQPSADRRTYRADFGKFARTFPDFEFRWRVPEGARDLADRLRALDLTRDLYRDPRFIRLHWLLQLLGEERLDGTLRWTTMAGEVLQ